jgi:site-specific DNA-methyltransferase (adenine-specific)
MMGVDSLPMNQVLEGDCLSIMATLPQDSVDLIFADPPYNLQLSQNLWRPNMTKVDAVDDDWDHFSSFEAYDRFSEKWLRACRSLLNDKGSIWVIGSYHNIFRIGKIMQDLGFWILNDVIWLKTNPMPNFRGVRFTNAHETLIWAAKDKTTRYTFNHHAMKEFNHGLQMRSDWELPLCTGSERIRIDGEKAHSTQKPESLLYRILLASSNPNDVVLDPFFGTGTTGAVAMKLHRNWIGIEREKHYVKIARERIAAITPEAYDQVAFDVRDRRWKEPRVPFAHLIELGLLLPGQKLFFEKDIEKAATIKPDGKLVMDSLEGSIHQLGKQLSGGSPCNGWEHWYYLDSEGRLNAIDTLRQMVRNRDDHGVDEI